MAMGKLTKHDVFLNHRGPDVKLTFVSHLNKALRQAGCNPFLDAKSLVKGQHAFNSISEALDAVLVHGTIFSPRYAESKYCLNELGVILQSQKPLIPVFFNVEPENLRFTEVGPFAQAFSKHLSKGRDEDVVRWKAALLKAADITGFRLVDSGNDSVKLEEKIVAAVLNALPPPFLLAPALYPVGLKETSAQVIDILDKMGDTSVGVVGIYGMGGIGKTTLAKEVYNQEQRNFNSRCFLRDVKDAKGVAVMNLQMKMVSDLLHVDAKRVHWEPGRWFDQIRKLEGKVLLVIDDICERKQFNELVPVLKELPPGSRVLITSRERNILKNIMLDVQESAIYHVPGLDLSNSMNLFIWCAFRANKITDVDPAFHDFVREISAACCGLPLALEVMGGFLADKEKLPEDEKYWKDATLALRNNVEINTSLRISYDGLVNEDDKRLFLDIACFMLGHPKEIAIEVWESNGDYTGPPSWSLSRLIDKCLVKVDANGTLWMHDLLRDMGRNIVTERAPYNKPEKRSHIWDSSVAYKTLQKTQGSDEVLALSIIQVDPNTVWSAEHFARMRELRYLRLEGRRVEGNFSGWSAELRWLQWRYFPYGELPLTLNLSNLAVLDLSKSRLLTGIWSANHKVECPCKEVRMLLLSKCIGLKELPEHINKMLKLRSLNLEGCSSLTSLPDSFGTLTQLEYLNLSFCILLTSLPDSFVNLLKLRELLVEGCAELRTLPMEFRRLRSLALFRASYVHLKLLPESCGLLPSLKEIDLTPSSSLEYLGGNSESRFENLGKGGLGNFEKLNLTRNENLQELPPSISGLKKQVLHMHDFIIVKLPEDFGQLQNLTEANFGNCGNLRELCASFGSLRSLRKLNLSHCESLTRLPDSFPNLSNLEELDLRGCWKLQMLPPSTCRLQKLRVLLMNMTALKELPEDFGQLQNLTEANFEHCRNLRELCASFGSLRSLRKLNLSHCVSLTRLPDSFPNLSNLEQLDLRGCGMLQMLPPSTCRLQKLRVLLMNYSALEILPEDFGRLQNLTEANFEHCRNLRELCASFGSLRSLRKLNLSHCVSLTRLPDSFPNLSNLEELDLRGCGMLQMLPPSTCRLQKLRVLLMNDSALEILPEDFGQLQNLTEANFEYCRNLQKLCASFGSLRSLRKLNLSHCVSLTRLPDSFPNLSNLEELDLHGCWKLQMLPPSTCRLQELRVLLMNDSALEILPEDFGQLQNLTEADFTSCWNLRELCASFGSLRSLQKLNLSFCGSLIRLPDSFSILSNLDELDLSSCGKLQMLPPSTCRLQKLRVLLMSDSALEILPEDFGQLQSLTVADFSYSQRLKSLCESFGCLRNLRELNLTGCRSLTKFSFSDSFSNLPNLEEFKLSDCEMILHLPPPICRLKNLRVLYMVKMALWEIPEDFGQLQSLTVADFSFCKRLQSLSESFGCLRNLRKLNLRGCCSLIQLPESFSKLSNLEILDLTDCLLYQTYPVSTKRLKVTI